MKYLVALALALGVLALAGIDAQAAVRCGPNGCYHYVRSTDQCNTACSLSAGVWKPKVFRGR